MDRTAKGCMYFSAHGFSINEGEKPVNVHMQWLTSECWFFVYVYLFGLRVEFIKRKGVVK